MIAELAVGIGLVILCSAMTDVLSAPCDPHRLSHLLRLFLSAFFALWFGLHCSAPGLFSAFVAVLLFIEFSLRNEFSGSNSNVEVNVDVFEDFDKQRMNVPA